MIKQLKMQALSGLLCSLCCGSFLTASAQQPPSPANPVPPPASFTLSRMKDPVSPPPNMWGDTVPPPALGDWSESDRTLARGFIHSYGNPGESASERLTWRDNWPWQTTIVTRAPHSMQTDKNGIGDGNNRAPLNTDNTGSTTQPPYHALQQTIVYRVPAEYYDDIEQFDKSIMVDRDAGLLTFYGDQEALNYLSVNLVNDIVTGKRTAAQARAYYDQISSGYAKGEKSLYTSGLMFQPQSTPPEKMGSSHPGSPIPAVINPPVNGNQPAVRSPESPKSVKATKTKSKTKTGKSGKSGKARTSPGTKTGTGGQNTTKSGNGGGR